MKAKVNFYWKGQLVEAGKDAPKDAPKSLCTTDEKKVVKKSEKVAAKTSTKDGRPKNLEDKAKKTVKAKK